MSEEMNYLYESNPRNSSTVHWYIESLRSTRKCFWNFLEQPPDLNNADFISHVPRTSRTSRPKKRTSRKWYPLFAIQKKSLISRADFVLKFIRVLFFFCDLAKPRRNSSRTVSHLLGFANLIFKTRILGENLGFEPFPRRRSKKQRIGRPTIM